MSSRRIRRRRGELGGSAGNVSPDWKNPETGRLNKGWKYGPDNTVIHVESGESFPRG